MLNLSAEQTNTTSTHLNITPLMDVMFLLLIFFLLASTFIRPAFEVELPGAAHSQLHQERTQRITISVNRTGQILIDEMPIALSELQPHLAKVLRQDREKAVLLQADKQSAFGLFVAVMDAAKGAGATQFIIETIRVAEESDHGQ